MTQEMETLQETLRELQTELAAHPGEFVLMCRHDQSQTSGSGGCFGGGTLYHHFAKTTLGIVSRNAIIARGRLGRMIPTDRYFGCNSFDRYSRGRLEEGPWEGFLEELVLPVEYHDPLDAKYLAGQMHLEIIVGDEAVAAWFETDDIPLANFTHPEKSRLWFQRAAEMLGRPLADAPELELEKEQRPSSILNSLWHLNSKIDPIRQRLEDINLAPRRGGILRTGVGISLVEDRDDVIVHSMRPRSELDRLLGELKTALKQADELGLHDHPYVVAFRLRYSPDSD